MTAQATRRETPAAASAAPLLELRAVSQHFGGIAALTDASFAVRAGSITGLIGPNGAGKTTVFNCLSRLYTPTSGDIVFQGRSLLALGAHAVAAAGIGRTFQNVSLFPSLSVFDNVRIGTHSATRGHLLADALRLPWGRTPEAQVHARVEREIDYLGLNDVAQTLVADLPFGIQKRVELARALAIDPQLVLLDEPAAGLNHEEIAALESLLRRVNAERGITLLLVEHHMPLVMSVCEHVAVLNFGRTIAQGTPAEVQASAAVIQAYLGDARP